jgi:hypothetical protein
MLGKGNEDFLWRKAGEVCIPSGHILNKPEILFGKIEDTQLENI